MKVWVPVVDYEGMYEVSTDGEIRSLSRVNAAGALRRERVLKSRPDKDGYQRIVAYRDGTKKDLYIHREVLKAFVGPREDGFEVRHLNGVRTDNRLANLTYGTDRENQADRIRHGTTCRGEHAPYAILTTEQVKEIRFRYALGGTSQAVLARKYQTSPTNIGHIVRRESWKDV